MSSLIVRWLGSFVVVFGKTQSFYPEKPRWENEAAKLRNYQTNQLEKGQVTVLGLLFLLTFVLLAAVLINVYTLFEARDWGYQVAQQAALAGVSVGRDWLGATLPPGGSCSGPGPVTLEPASSQNAAIELIQLAMI